MNINCPKCNKKVMTWDEKSTMPLRAKCNNCKKLVLFDSKTKSITTSDVPDRYASSGMRFY